MKSLIWSATPTPFRADGALDVNALEKVVEQHLRLGVEGLFLAGSCGEGPLMPNAQRVELVQAVKRLAKGRLHLAVQVSDTSAARVRENMKQAQDAGADSAVIAPPWITRFCNREFARRYFLEPLDAATLPVGIYVLKQPPETGLDLALWKEIIAHPKAAYVKDSSCSEEYIRGFCEMKKRRPALVLETGYEFDTLIAARNGYDGCLLGSGILIGGMIRRALDAHAAGDAATADAWQKRSNAFLWDLFRQDIGCWLAGLKYALVRRGLFNTAFMHVYYPLAADDRRRIDAALEREKEFI